MNLSYRVLKPCRTFRCGMMLAVTIATLCAFGNAASPPAPGDVAPVAVRLETDASNNVAVVVGSYSAALPALPTAPATLSTNGVQLSRMEDNSLLLFAEKAEVKLLAPAFDQTGMAVPAQNRLQLHLNPQRRIMEFSTPSNNGGQVSVELADGTLAALTAESRLRLDLYEDHSYVMTGGDNVSVRRTDGTGVTLSTASIPVTGGPKASAPITAGAGPAQTTTATTEIKVTGTMDGELRIQAGTQTFRLEPGGNQRIRLPNGTDIELTQGLATPGLIWTVEKGDIHLSLDAEPAIKIITETGQRGRLTWETGPDGNIQIKNSSASGHVVVSTGNKTPVTVEPGGTLQVKIGEKADEYSLNWVRRGAEASRSLIRLEAREREGIIVRVGDEQATSLQALQQNGGRPVATPWGSISLGQDGKGLVVKADTLDVVISIAGFNGWLARIPAGGQLQLNLEPSLRLVDLAVLSNAQQPVAVDLPDGAAAVLPEGSRLRYDLFNDQSYALSGYGKGQVRTADGSTHAITSGALPVTGGPSVVVTDSQGKGRTERLAPTTDLKINGTLGSALEIQLGSQTFNLDLGQTRQIDLPNGTSLELTQGQSSPSLTWLVTKGDVRLSVAEASGVKTVTKTGQRGRLTWNGRANGHSLSLENNSGNGTSMVITAGANPIALEAGGVVVLDRMQNTGEYDLIWTRRGQGVGTVSLRLEPDAGGMRAVLNGEVLATGPGLKAAGESGIAGSWGSLVSGKETGEVTIRAGKLPLLVTVSGFESWQALLPPDNQMNLTANASMRLIDVAAAARNKNKITLNILEGASLTAGSAAFVRYDVYSDQSFTLTGKGDIEIRQAGFAPEKLTVNNVPVTGGPLTIANNSQGRPQTARIVPTTPIKVSGSLGSELELEIAGQSSRLAPGQTKEIKLPNGTYLELTQGLATAGLTWTAHKGDARISVETAGGVKAITQTGQRGRIVWQDHENAGLQVENNSNPYSGSIVVVAGSESPVGMEAGSALHVSLDQNRQFAHNWARRGPEAIGVTVHLSLGGTNGISARVNGVLAGSVLGIKAQGQRPITNDWGAISLGADGQSLTLAAAAEDINVMVDDFDGWQARIPAGNQLQVGFDPGLKLIDVRTPAENLRAVGIGLHDGAVAKVGVGSRLRYDFFKDQSYALTGAGSITVQTADGTMQSLSSASLPVTGGPVVVMQDAAGKGRTVRIAPTLPLKVSGTLGAELEVEIAGQQFKLLPGQSQRVALTNGTALEITEGQGAAGLTWFVSKGDVRVNVETAGGVKVVTETGQRGRIAWQDPQNAAGLIVENNSQFGGQMAVSLDNKLAGLEAGGVALITRDAGNALTLSRTRRGPEENAILVRLEADPEGGLRVQANGEITATGQSLREANGQPIATGWGSLSLGPDASTVSVRAGTQDVVVNVAGFAEWETFIPKGNNSANITPDYVQALIDIRAALNNGQRVMTLLQDGGITMAGPNSKLRYDVFPDSSYVLTGGRVEIKDGNGGEFKLTANSIPVTGGPLVEMQTPDGLKLQRLAPTSNLKISGSPGSELEVSIADQNFKLEPGQSRQVRLANGTALELSSGQGATGLSWSVSKGDARVSVETAGGVKAITETGQRGRLTWNHRQGAGYELENTSDTGIIVVLVPGQNAVAVEPHGDLLVTRNRPQQPGFAVSWVHRGPGGVATELNIEPNQSDVLRAKAGGDLITTIASLRDKAEPSVSTEWGTIDLGKDKNSLVITAETTDMVVAVSGFNGWEAQVPAGNKIIVTVNEARHLVELSTPAGNSQNVSINFADGAGAQVGSDSSVRYDSFLDQSYLLSGSGRVSVTTADGVVSSLVSGRLPVTGGGLVPRSNPTTGISSVERSSPTTDIKVYGSVGPDLSVRIGDQSWKIPTVGTETIPLANGSEIKFRQNVSNGKLEWEVVKGDFRLTIDSVPGWKSVVSTGQSGSFSWDGNSRTVETSNDSDTYPIIVVLPNGTTVTIPSGATFQVAIIDSVTFATAAVGGNVVLHDPGTGQDVSLQQSNLMFKSGVAYGENAPSLPVPGQAQATPLTVKWTENGLQVSGTSVTLDIKPGTEQVYRSGDGAEMVISIGLDGNVSFASNSGAFVIKPDTGPNWSIELNQGNSISVNNNPSRGTFSAHSGANNLGSVKITTGDGISPLLGADSTLTLISGQSRGPAGVGGGGILFTEDAGGDNSGPTITPSSSPILNPTSSLDTSRITQPPVSVFR